MRSIKVLMGRMIHLRALIGAAAVAAAVAVPTGDAQQNQRSQQPARDTPAQTQDSPPPGGLITGHIYAADTGRPVKRARVFVSAAELPGGRGILTDDMGAYELTELPAG